jgi:WD40 repeat protein/Ca2+-binding EF-hand superfamily protein
MGQKLGKASFDDAIIPFLNLPAPAINAVWTAFNLTAEGWGLRLDVFSGISKPLATFLGADDPTMQTYSKNLFELLDTDMNGVVDALEFICTLAMLSAMEPRDKVRFVFTVYDFSEKGTLLVDEITLAVKSTVEGLCKVSKLMAPPTSDYESLSRLAFASCGKTLQDSSNNTYLTLAEFLAYVNSSPTTSSWMGYYDDIADTAGNAPPPTTILTPCPDFSEYVEINNKEMMENNKVVAAANGSLKPPPWYRAPVVDESYVPEEGEETAVKYLDEGTPCYDALTELLKPDGKVKPLLTVPDSQLQLEWVHGVNTSCRQHIHYLNDGSIVYPSGSIGIIYRFPTEDGDGTATQNFFTEHGDIVSALAVSKGSSSLVASADSRSSSNGCPRILLWKSSATSSSNLPLVASLGAGQWECGCPPFALHFSEDGSKLLSLAVASLPPPPTPAQAVSLLNKNGKDGENAAAASSGSTSKVAKSYIIAVHDTQTRACIFSTVVDSYGAVFDAKWCSTTTASKFKAKGGVGGGLGAPGASFCLGTSRGVVFFSPSESSGVSGSYEARRGVGGAKTLVEAHVSLTSLDGCEEMAAGGMSGTLFRYEGRSVAVCAKAHNSAITVVKYINAANNQAGGGDERIFSGSLDATIKVWEPRELAPLATIDLMTLGASLGREVLSMGISNNGAKMLVCTSGAEVWELGLATGSAEGDDESSEVVEGGGNTLGKPLNGNTPLFNGHFGESVAALVSSPVSAEFASGGSDGTVRIYDANSKSVVRLKQLSVGQPISALAYSPDGTLLLAGVGGGVDVLDPSSLGAGDRLSRLDIDAAMASMKQVKVLMIRFSPDGSIASYFDSFGKLGIYSVGGWSMKKIHDIPTMLSIKKEDVCDVEISEDNQWIQIGTNNLQLFYFSLETGEIAKEGFRTVKTAGGRFPTCGPGPAKIAYEKQESHPPSCEGPQDLCCVIASPNASLQLCGDKQGNLHLYHYPCMAPVVSALALVAAATAGEPPPNMSGTAGGGSTWNAHTYGGVSGICFIAGDAQVCSAGRKDLTVQQWKLDVNEQRNDESPPEAGENEDEDGDEDGEPGEVVLQDVEDPVLEGEDYITGEVLGQLDQPPLFRALKSRDVGDITELINEFSNHPDGKWHQTLPYFKNTLTPPTYPQKAQIESPSTKLEMDWVYGANLKSSLSSVHYAKNGHIVYPAASLVVVLNKGDADINNKSQLVISAHTEEVTCVAMHPDGEIIASGQRGPDVHVSLTSALTGQVLARLQPRVKSDPSLAQAVTAICFSHDGNLVAFSTADEENTLHLYGTHDGELRGSAASGSNKVLCLSFSPDESGELLQGGVDHFAVWSVRGRSLGKRRGLFGPECPKQAILACCWIPVFGDNEAPIAILGAQDGSLLKLDGRAVSEVSKACKGGIGSMCSFVPQAEDGPCLCIGGRDGQVLLCGPDLQPMITINLRDKKYNCFRWAVRSVCLNKDRRKVLIGTAGNEIFEISATEEAVDMNEGALVTGHCRGKLGGIAAHPLNNEFATAGDDKTIRLWNSETHELIRMLPLSQEATSCAYSPDGYLLAVGLKTGGVVIVSLLKPVLDVVKELREEGSGGKVTSVRFSHNGRVLAAAAENSADSSVVFYDCENTASPGGAFTLKSKFDLFSVSTACGHAAAQAIRAETADPEQKSSASPAVQEYNLLPTQPCTMDFSSDSSVLQYGTNNGLLIVSVDTGAAVGLAAASKEALNYNDRVSRGEIDVTTNKFHAGLAAQAIMSSAATTYKDEKWASYTVPMGWACQGIYSPGSTQGSIRGVCRSGDNSLLCTADIYGRTNIFKWPPVLPTAPTADGEGDANVASSSASVTSLSSNNTDNKNSIDGMESDSYVEGAGFAPCRTFYGHGGSVGGCVFVKGEQSVATIGYNDRAIILWKCVKTATTASEDEEAAEEAAAAAKSDDLDEDMDEDDVDFDELEKLEAAKAAKLIEEEARQQAIEDAYTDPAVLLDLFSKAPSQVTKLYNQQAPSFVFGISTFRGNMFVNGDGNPLYCAGGLGVVYQRKIHSQLFMRAHSSGKPKGKGYPQPSETGGLIRVMKYCAGGGTGSRNNICCSGDALGDVVVWDSSTGTERCTLPRGLHAQSEIAALAICGSSGGSNKGGLLVTVGNDSKSMMGVWESPSGSWNKDVVLVASASASSASNGKVLFACFAEGAPFLPSEKDKTLYTYATGGQDGVQFWSISCGNITSDRGKFVDVEPENTCTCAVSISLPQPPPMPKPQVARMTGKLSASGAMESQLLLDEGEEEVTKPDPLMIVGGASGRLMLWEGTKCSKVFKAHNSAVTDVRTVKLDVSPLATGSESYYGRVGVVSSSLDGTVKVFALMNDASGNYLALTSCFDVNTEVIPRPIRSSVVAVSPDQNFTRLVLLTASGEVIEVVRDSRTATQIFSAHTQVYEGGDIAGGGVLVKDRNTSSSSSSSRRNNNSRSIRTVEGCCVHARHPTENDLLVSGGGDGTIRVWSQSGKCVLSILELGSPVAALTWFIPKVADNTAATETGASVDANGEAIHSLAVVLNPNGKVVQVCIDLKTMELSNHKVLIAGISPVPSYIVGCLSGPRIFRTIARVESGRFGEIEETVKHFAMASGKSIDDNAASKASFPPRDRDAGAEVDQAGACILLF